MAYAQAYLIRKDFKRYARAQLLLLFSVATFLPLRFYIGHCHVANSEMLRETPTQRGVQRRGHTGEKDSGISYHLHENSASA